MRITLSEIGGFKDALLAQSIELLAKEIGATFERRESVDGVSVPLSAPEVKACTQPRPIGKPKPGAGSVKKSVIAAAKTAGEEPQLTIRQRILDFLKSGPRANSEIKKALLAAGLPESVDVDQHLYLMRRDKRITRMDDGRHKVA
jgi:hypothetical protein